jgi:hypothetical protein
MIPTIRTTPYLQSTHIYTSSHLGRHAVSREAGDLLLKDETMWLF